MYDLNTQIQVDDVQVIPTKQVHYIDSEHNRVDNQNHYRLEVQSNRV